jgi:Transposase DDE domain
MSHQDKDPRLDGQCLKEALQWLFQGIDWNSIKFRKECLWMPVTLVHMAILFVWSGESTLGHRFRRALRIVKALFPEGLREKPLQKNKKGRTRRNRQKAGKNKSKSQKCLRAAKRRKPRAQQPQLPTKRKKKKHKKKKKLSVSYQAFLKLLRKWTPQFVVLIQNELRQRMLVLFQDCLEMYGFIVFGCDGSRLDLPRTLSNEQAYAPSRKRRGGAAARAQRKRKKARRDKRRRAKQRKHSRKADVPQMWLTLMFHLGTGLPWDWRIGPSDSSERAHLLAMLSTLPPEALITADAGFVGYEYLRAIHESGRSLLIRVGSNVHLLKKLGVFKESHNRVYLWPHDRAKKGEEPLVLRLVVAQTGKHPVYLVTTVLSEKRLSDAHVVKIYSKRWRVEVHYRHFKQTYEKRKLRSHSSQNAHVELEWSLLGLWTMLLYTLVEVRKTGADPEKLSCADAWREIRDTMNDYLHVTQPGERLRDRLGFAVTDDYVRENKTSRDYCRKKQEKPAGAPQITTATPSQVALAVTLYCNNRRKGLTA